MSADCTHEWGPWTIGPVWRTRRCIACRGMAIESDDGRPEDIEAILGEIALDWREHVRKDGTNVG